MMRLSLLTRWVVATLLSVSVPLCCCQSQGLLGVLWGEVTTHTDAGGEGLHSVQTLAHTGGAKHGEMVAGVAAQHGKRGSCHGLPGDSRPCEDTSGCPCGHVTMLASGAAGAVVPTVQITPSLFSTPADISPSGLRNRPARRIQLDASGVPRPPTSLLRLRCALLI